jgi:hypothetical protein
MIDRAARDRLAELVRHFVSNRISNIDFDDAAFDIKSKDPAVKAIREELWLCYDDFSTHQLELSKDERRIISRWVMFLKTDCEYVWRKRPNWKRPGNNEAFWPFASENDFRAALDDPRYLANAS